MNPTLKEIAEIFEDKFEMRIHPFSTEDRFEVLVFLEEYDYFLFFRQGEPFTQILPNLKNGNRLIRYD